MIVLIKFKFINLNLLLLGSCFFVCKCINFYKINALFCGYLCFYNFYKLWISLCYILSTGCLKHYPQVVLNLNLKSYGLFLIYFLKLIMTDVDNLARMATRLCGRELFFH